MIRFRQNNQEDIDFKANRLACIASRWYGSRFSADFQQKLFLSKHDTGGRFLLVTLLRNRRKTIARILLA